MTQDEPEWLAANMSAHVEARQSEYNMIVYTFYYNPKVYNNKDTVKIIE